MTRIVFAVLLLMFGKAEAQHKQLPDKDDRLIGFYWMETEPVYRAGMREMQKLFCDSADESILPLLKDSIARVTIRYTIDTTGAVVNIEVATGTDSLAIAEGMRLVGLTSKWKPATRNGVKVESYKVQPFTFSKSDCGTTGSDGEESNKTKSVCCAIFYKD